VFIDILFPCARGKAVRNDDNCRAAYRTQIVIQGKQGYDSLCRPGLVVWETEGRKIARDGNQSSITEKRQAGATRFDQIGARVAGELRGQ